MTLAMRRLRHRAIRRWAVPWGRRRAAQSTVADTITESPHQHVGNTGLNGAGMTLGEFLEARGSLAKSTSTIRGDVSDPASPTHPWLAFTADWCSVPASWLINLLQAIINALAETSLDLAQYIVQEADFDGERVPFYYACLRHDFNWRNLHRVEHHFHQDTSGVWTSAVRSEADERFRQDLIVLCNANQYGSPPVPENWDWMLSRENRDTCRSVANEFKLGVSTVPFSAIHYIH